MPRCERVERTRSRDLKPLHAARERSTIVGLDDELEPVIVAIAAPGDADIDDPEIAALVRVSDRPLDRAYRASAA